MNAPATYDPTENIKDLLASRAQHREQNAKHNQAIRLCADEITQIESDGDLFDDAVISRLAILKVKVPVMKQRVTVLGQYEDDTNQKLLDYCSPFVRHTLWPAIQDAQEKVRVKVSAKIKGAFTNPDLLLQAVENSDLAQQLYTFRIATELRYSLNDFSTPAGIDSYARNILDTWAELQSFVARELK